MKAYTPENMRYADKYSIESLSVPGITLMDRAADALFEALRPYFGKSGKFVILCGKGNNGGDGWALGAKLATAHEITVCISVAGDSTSFDSVYYYGKCRESADLGRPITIIDALTDFRTACMEISSAYVIVDAIFGTGFSGEIDNGSVIAELINLSSITNCTKIAADIPSGADSHTGRCSQNTFRADLTVTFAKLKIGMMSYPARPFCGNITVADIGIPEYVFESLNSRYEITDSDVIKAYLPKRFPESHKGSFGKLLCLAGSPDMTGAAHLALSGALRTGVGLTVFASDKYVTDIMKHRLSEPIYLPVCDSEEDTDRLVGYSSGCTAMLIGCGLGKDEITKKRVHRLIRECDCPIILDADGINAVSDNINIISEAKKGILLTPHPLEFSRISGYSTDLINSSRLECACSFSDKYGCTLLLKGAGTVIRDKDGRICINPIACSGLSKGGSGDVLAGIIASFAAQGAGLYESAVLGAYLHGCAGNELSAELSEYGVMPSDIPERVARILARTV